MTIVITGFGASTPLGGDAATTWAGLLASRSGIGRLTEDWAQDMPTRIAGHAAVDPATSLDRVEARRLDRASQFAILVALEAWADAGLGLGEANPVDPDRLAVCCATGIGGLSSLVSNWDALRDKGFRRVSPFTIPMLMANAPAANVGLRLGAKAGVHAPVSACASSSEAIALAIDLIRIGRADVVVAGGAEAVIHPLPVAAFGQMQALSRRNDEPERASRPWDVDRDGFVLGEGATMLVLERLEDALARGARIYGTLAGAGISADSHDLVQPDPNGEGQSTAMAKALKEADLTPDDIVHVNAHATSTPQGDTTEARSIRRALGEAADRAVVTGTKSVTGHLLGGAGALETFAATMALLTRQVPATANLEHPEPGLEIDIATATREVPAGDLAGQNNSFGFGGHNVSVVVTNQHASREA